MLSVLVASPASISWRLVLNRLEHFILLQFNFSVFQLYAESTSIVVVPVMAWKIDLFISSLLAHINVTLRVTENFGECMHHLSNCRIANQFHYSMDFNPVFRYYMSGLCRHYQRLIGLIRFSKHCVLFVSRAIYTFLSLLLIFLWSPSNTVIVCLLCCTGRHIQSITPWALGYTPHFSTSFLAFRIIPLVCWRFEDCTGNVYLLKFFNITNL